MGVKKPEGFNMELQIERVKLAKRQIAQLLEKGHALCSEDLGDEYERFGLPRISAETNLMREMNVGFFTHETGVPVYSAEKLLPNGRRKKIYFAPLI